MVVDLDHDGIDDLVLASIDPSAPALYVLLGDFDGIGAGYHAAVATHMSPVALDVADVTADGEPDLVAFGPAGSGALVEAFPSLTPVTFADPWRAEAKNLQTVSASYALVRVLDFGPDGVPDLVLADELHAETGRPSAATPIAFGDMKIAPLQPLPDTFADPSLAYLTARAGGGQNLVLVTGFITAVYEDIGAGQATAPHAIHNDQGFNATALCDVDGDGALEVVGGGGGWDAIAPWPKDVRYEYDQKPGFGLSTDLPASVCAELVADPADRVDLAVLQNRAANGGGVRVNVLPDLHLLDTPAPAMVTSVASPLCLDLPATRAVVLVVGDFDGDHARELVVVAADGAITVIQPTALAACP